MFVGLADTILWFHVGVVLFNVFGLVVVPIGAWRGWGFVRIFRWRALHLECWPGGNPGGLRTGLFPYDLAKRPPATGGPSGSSGPFNQQWATRLIFWPLPLWFFVVLYLAVWSMRLPFGGWSRRVAGRDRFSASSGWRVDVGRSQARMV